MAPTTPLVAKVTSLSEFLGGGVYVVTEWFEDQLSPSPVHVNSHVFPRLLTSKEVIDSLPDGRVVIQGKAEWPVVEVDGHWRPRTDITLPLKTVSPSRNEIVRAIKESILRYEPTAAKRQGASRLIEIDTFPPATPALILASMDLLDEWILQ